MHPLPEGCVLCILLRWSPPLLSDVSHEIQPFIWASLDWIESEGKHLQGTGGNATPWENEGRNVCLVQCGRQSAVSHHSSQLGGGFNRPTSPSAANRSFHSSHLYSIYVSMVRCLVLLNTHFVNVFFHVLIRLLQNPTRRLPKMSHVCQQGCLQDVSAQRCRAMQEAWEKTTWHSTKAYLLERMP